VADLNRKTQKIVIFEEDGSGDYKIAGIQVYGRDIEIVKVYNVSGPLPPLIDEPKEFITDDFEADLVLDFLKHPDLSEYLVTVCLKKSIPVIASGQHIPGAITPFTCCGLGKRGDLGQYGAQFGVPEYEVKVEDGKIVSMEVRRGASCGATWQVIDRIRGLTVEEALAAIGREVQFICMADPSAFDPVSGKSSLHYAGDVHIKALKKALLMAGKSKDGTG